MHIYEEWDTLSTEHQTFDNFLVIFMVKYNGFSKALKGSKLMTRRYKLTTISL